MMDFSKAYNRADFVNYLRRDFLPDDFEQEEKNVPFWTQMNYASVATCLGKSKTLDLVVYEIKHHSPHDARVGLSKDAFRMLAGEKQNRALVIFVPEDNSDNYRFSLIEIQLSIGENDSNVTRAYSNPRRYSYYLGKGIACYTPNKYLNELGRVEDVKDLFERFSVEVLTKAFYQELSDWYAWAIKVISFPNDISTQADDKRHNHEGVIRLITRLIFVWFLKERKLIPWQFFDQEYIANHLIKGFNPHKIDNLFGKSEASVYYRAILQNLFFAMLNCPITKEGGTEFTERRFKDNRSQFDDNKLMRYRDEFNDPDEFLRLANETVPFLNGGLFDCLDEKRTGMYYDGFSERKESMAQLIFSARRPTTKEKWRNEVVRLRKEIADLLLEKDCIGNEQAAQLAQWDMFDQNTFAPFFDPEWMFGIKEGFDILIANPPYISTKGVSTADKKLFEAEFGFSDDTYNLFFFKGFSLLCEGGCITYITPKTFWTTQTKRNLRDLLLANTLNYVFDTANPFEAVMVDTCITSAVKNKPAAENLVRFMDGRKSLLQPERLTVAQSVYLNTQNSVIFKPSELNMRIYELYGEKVKALYDKWWDKIKTSRDIEKNKRELEEYRASLKPGDVALLGCLTEGGQGLATANNGKYIAVRSTTKWAENIRVSRPKKLADFLARTPKAITAEMRRYPSYIAFLQSLSEAEIAELFDSLKEQYGRDIFGQGYLYKIVDDCEIADVDSLTDDEKENGIETTKPYYVPYDKGDKDGNRWYLETPFAIAWSKENVRFLKTDPKARYQGYTFYFREGFCWNNVLTTYMKCKKKEKTVQSTESMSFFSCTEQTPEYYLISIMNSRFAAFYVDNLVNSTSHCTTGDAKLIPIMIPTIEQLYECKRLFDKAFDLKRSVAKGIATDLDISEELNAVERANDLIVESIYQL